MMYGWWDYGASPPWYGMIFGPIMMIVSVVLTALIIAWVLRAFGLGWQSSTQGKSAMTRLKSPTSATLPVVAFAVLVAASPIGAQPAPQGRGPSMTSPGPSGQTPPQMPGGMMGMMGQGGMMPMMEMGGHVEGRIAFLKTELKISDAQTPQWNAFADALRANAQRMREMPNTMMQGGMMGQGGASVSAPDRLGRMEKMMTAMLDAVKATKSALAPLYAVLTDEQKKMADQLIHGPMGMGRM